jgi:hypothetical protein
MDMEEVKPKIVESLMAKEAKKAKKLKPMKAFVPSDQDAKPVVVTMEDRYRAAFKVVYGKLKKFEQIEVDNFPVGGNLPLTGREKDFARRVASLAEK